MGCDWAGGPTECLRLGVSRPSPAFRIGKGHRRLMPGTRACRHRMAAILARTPPTGVTWKPA